MNYSNENLSTIHKYMNKVQFSGNFPSVLIGRIVVQRVWTENLKIASIITHYEYYQYFIIRNLHLQLEASVARVTV